MTQKSSFTIIAALPHDAQVSGESTGSNEPERLGDEYRRIGFLGRGAQGTVIRAIKTEEPNKVVAIKLLARGRERMPKRMQRELITQNSLCHPHIVHLERVILSETHLGIVLEYMPGGNLEEYCNREQENQAISEDRVRSYMAQLFMALHYMHQRGVVNRDIKLENLLLDESHRIVKLADFGLAKGPLDSNPKSIVGTLFYTAPEVLGGETYDGQLADIWSCGVCLFRLLFKDYPFVEPGELGLPRATAATYEKIAQRRRDGDLRIPIRPDVSDLSKDLIRECLQPIPRDRLPLAAILKHDWFPPELESTVQDTTAQCLPIEPSITVEDMEGFAEAACQNPGQ